MSSRWNNKYRTGRKYDALGNFSEAVTYTLLGNGSTYTLTVTADESWINAKGRSFPVTIDPTYIEVSGYAYDTFIDSDLPDNTRATTSTFFLINLFVVIKEIAYILHWYLIR